MTRTLNASKEDDARRLIEDLGTVGDPFKWRLVCKAYSKIEGWMKSTKAMDIPGAGVIVQVTTRETEAARGLAVAEALTFVPNTFLMEKEDGTVEILAMVLPAMGSGAIDLTSSMVPGYMAEETP